MTFLNVCRVTGFSAMIFLAFAFPSNAQVPGILNYQGRVVVNSTNFTGTGQFKFALVDGTGSRTFWSNDGTGGGEPASSVSVTVSKGLYSVLLGQSPMAAISPTVFTNSDVRLRVWFNDGTGIQRLTPDQRIAAVGYALAAARADSVDAVNLSGTISDARLSTNVALLAGSPAFTGRVTAAAFTGNGASLTGLNAAQITSGTLSDARLSANVALKNASNTVFAGDLAAANLTVSDIMATSFSGGGLYATREGKVGVGWWPSETLDVAGAVRIANTINPTPPAGTIRWTGTDFQGYNGQQWLSLTMPAPADMVRVPASTFMMGSTVATNDGVSDMVPVHSVTLSAFYLAKYETTYGLWYDVFLWATNHSYRFENHGDEGSQTLYYPRWYPPNPPTENAAMPVVTISWRDCIVWCNAYSEMQGLSPVYTYTNAVIRDSRDANATACDNAVFNQDRSGYRLPTEAEWEYAARYIDGRVQTPGNYASGAGGPYTDTNACLDVSWYGINCTLVGYGTRPVGTKRANQLGIYDMSGNVGEWCWDWYAAYSNNPSTNPVGPATGQYRCIRIGCWNVSPVGIQCCLRLAINSTWDGLGQSGFRLVRNGQ